MMCILAAIAALHRLVSFRVVLNTIVKRETAATNRSDSLHRIRCAATGVGKTMDFAGGNAGAHRHYTKIDPPGSIFRGGNRRANANLQFSGVRFGGITSARRMPDSFLAHRPLAVSAALGRCARVLRRHNAATQKARRIHDRRIRYSRLIQMIATARSELVFCHLALALSGFGYSPIWHVCSYQIWHSVLRTLRVAARFTSIIRGSESAPVAEFARFQARGYCLSCAFSLCSIHTLVPSRSPSKSRNHKSRVP